MNTLLTDTLDLLHHAVEPRHVIAKNADVGLEWLHKFARNEIGDPGINRVQRLHDYLESKSKATAA